MKGPDFLTKPTINEAPRGSEPLIIVEASHFNAVDMTGAMTTAFFLRSSIVFKVYFIFIKFMWFRAPFFLTLEVCRTST